MRQAGPQKDPAYKTGYWQQHLQRVVHLVTDRTCVVELDDLSRQFVSGSGFRQ
jgi:hypothetical protein